jgi:heme/copper-type cytochrome/quinol oxidase subunit 2
MDFITFITMLFVVLIVWGGLVTFLRKAYKYEKVKSKDGKE